MSLIRHHQSPLKELEKNESYDLLNYLENDLSFLCKDFFFLTKKHFSKEVIDKTIII